MRLPLNLLILVFCFSSLLCAAQKKTASQPALQKSIDSLYTGQQQLQQRLSMAMTDSVRILCDRAVRTDREKCRVRVQRIVEQFGFPSYELVGTESSKRFCVLVQHCFRDTELQRRVLAIMEPELKKKNVDGPSYASLTDLVATTSGQPQVYGTLLTFNGGDGGKKVRQPLMDPANVNKRRKSVDLEPLEDYLGKQNKIHKAKVKQKAK